jgi:succinoglycan biosynthesis protein ExoA
VTTAQMQLERQPRPAVGRTRASVTVVAPVRNEAAFIADTLDQLLDQELEGIDLEVVVVDGQSTDETREIVKQFAERYPGIRLLENPKRLSSAARNQAIRNSVGDYVVIIDGHCEIPSRRYFIELVRAFEESGADCLGRPQPLDVSRATTFQTAISLARTSRLGHHPESFIYSAQPQFVPAKSVAVAYRREVFDKVGLFDEAFDAHEDGEFNHRCDQAGLRCYFTPAIAVNYSPRNSLAGLFKQMVRYGRGRVRFSRKHPGTWGLGTLIPALLVLFVILGGMAAAFIPGLRLLYALVLAIYGATLLLSAARIAWTNRDWGLLVKVPLVFVALHVGAGIGILAEWFGIHGLSSNTR